MSSTLASSIRFNGAQLASPSLTADNTPLYTRFLLEHRERQSLDSVQNVMVLALDRVMSPSPEVD